MLRRTAQTKFGNIRNITYKLFPVDPEPRNRQRACHLSKHCSALLLSNRFEYVHKN